MEELREKIAAAMKKARFDASVPVQEFDLYIADAFLAIPEIAEALRATADGGELDVYRANCEYPD